LQGCARSPFEKAKAGVDQGDNMDMRFKLLLGTALAAALALPLLAPCGPACADESNELLDWVDDIYGTDSDVPQQRDENGYLQVSMDINGYENYTLGQPVSNFIAAEDLDEFRSPESDDEFSWYDMLFSTDEIQYNLSVGTHGRGGNIGSIVMYMDETYGDATFYHIKQQLDAAAGYTLELQAHDKVSGGLTLWMADADGDTMEVSYIPANEQGVEPGTSVSVTSMAYMGALFQSILNSPAEGEGAAAAPSTQ
jgi:hypothetical protein